MAFGNYATRQGTEVERDESYKKIVDKRDVPDIGKGTLYFRFLSLDENDFSHGMKFWLSTGVVKNGKVVNIPFVSSLPFSDFVGTNQQTGSVYVSWKVGADKCPLAKLAKEGHPVISTQSFNGGEPKPSVNAYHAARIQLIEVQRDAKGNAIKDDKGLPKFTIHAEERILEMTQGWWDQLVRIVEPEETTQVDDGFTSAPAKATKAFPTKDLTKVVWMLSKQKRTVNPNPNPKLNVDYVLDFSDKVVLDNPPAITEAPIDFAKVFKTISDDELKKMMAKHTGTEEGDEHNPESYGEALDNGNPEGSPEDGF